MTENTIPADKIADKIQDILTGISNGVYEVGAGRGVSGIAEDLRALLPAPKLRTMAEMTPAEREACKWMQCEESHAPSGGTKARGIILSSDERSSMIMERSGAFVLWPNTLVTPLPDPTVVAQDEQIERLRQAVREADLMIHETNTGWAGTNTPYSEPDWQKTYDLLPGDMENPNDSMTDHILVDKIQDILTGISNGVYEVGAGRGVSGIAEDLRALLPAPTLPTLADLHEDDRKHCRGMQALVRGFTDWHILGEDPRHPDSWIVMTLSGRIDSADPEDIQPLPDEPGLVWSASVPVTEDTQESLDQALDDAGIRTPKLPTRPEDLNLYYPDAIWKGVDEWVRKEKEHSFCAEDFDQAKRWYAVELALLVVRGLIDTPKSAPEQAPFGNFEQNPTAPPKTGEAWRVRYAPAPHEQFNVLYGVGGDARDWQGSEWKAKDLIPLHRLVPEQEPSHPAKLVTEEDYRNAPKRTVVWGRGKSAVVDTALEKYGDLWFETGDEVTVTHRDMGRNGPHEVLRWGDVS